MDMSESLPYPRGLQGLVTLRLPLNYEVHVEGV